MKHPLLFLQIGLSRHTRTRSLLNRRYKVDGKVGGIPVIAFHGMGSSRLTWLGGKTLDEIVPGSNVMLVAVDRPGYGDSTDPPTGYSYVQFALDVKELADHLNLTTFCVAGHSSGGPYALACAAVLKDRVTASAIICSDPPYAHPKAPVIIRDSDSFGARWYGLDPTDAVRAMRLGALASRNPKKEHAWKQGELGFVTDFTLERIPWSFRVEDITPGSSITFWVGTDDNPAMIHGAPFMHSLVPGSRLRIVSGGTHGFKSDPFHLANILSELESVSSAKKGRRVSWWPF